MLPCSICSTAFPYHRSCDLAHEGVCHDCASRNLTGGYDTYEHLPPPSLPRAPALRPSELAAVRRYMQHVQAVGGTGPLVDLVTEEGTP